MKSIRSFLLVALFSTVLLGNLLAAVFGYRVSMRAAHSMLDTQLADTAALMEALPVPDIAVAKRPSDWLAFQIWTENGKLLARSDNAGIAPIAGFEEGYRDVEFDGFRWRVIGRFDETARRWYLVAERIDIRNELALDVVLMAVAPILISVPVIALFVWLAVGNGLSLIQRLAAELRGKRADDLSRLRTSDPPLELAPVVDAVNDLLRRLDDAVLRERRFAADAAHELRTPLSALKVNLHNLYTELPDETDKLALLDRDLSRLGHLVEQMMLLYRLSPEHYQANMEMLDLHRLAQSVISELYEQIERKGQSISLHGESLSIIGDAASLQILVSNLILNASKYSPEGAEIRVSVERAEFGIRFRVSDTGPGIPLTELKRVFDRFYRVGGDRHSSSEPGCGLGLAIVQYIADLHHAKLHAENNSDGPGLSVDVTFPIEFDDPLFAPGYPS